MWVSCQTLEATRHVKDSEDEEEVMEEAHETPQPWYNFV